MSHFAEINSDNIVQRVIVAEQDFIDSLENSSSWIQTSYNTRGGKHYAPNSNTEDGGVALRKNYAGVGYTYDPTRDAFIPLQPYPSWTLDEDTCIWASPVSYPSDGKIYLWDESSTSWKESE